MIKKEIEDLAYVLESSLLNFKKQFFVYEDNTGLKKAEKYFLFMIHALNLEGQDRPSEIAQKLGVSMPAITHHINSLETQGYVSRIASRSDRRIVHVTLSKKGQKVLEKLKKMHHKRLYALVEILGEKDSKTLVSLLSKVNNFNESKVDEQKGSKK